MMPDSNSTWYTAGTQIFIDSLNEETLNEWIKWTREQLLPLRMLNSKWGLRNIDYLLLH